MADGRFRIQMIQISSSDRPPRRRPCPITEQASLAGNWILERMRRTHQEQGALGVADVSAEVNRKATTRCPVVLVQPAGLRTRRLEPRACMHEPQEVALEGCKVVALDVRAWRTRTVCE